MASSDLFNLQGKVACVTGASSGLGRYAAKFLAEQGAQVIGVARREVSGNARHIAKFGCANRREILWMREHHSPAIPDPVVKTDRALSRLRLKIRRGIINTQAHLKSPRCHVSKITERQANSAPTPLPASLQRPTRFGKPLNALGQTRPTFIPLRHFYSPCRAHPPLPRTAQRFRTD